MKAILKLFLCAILLNGYHVFAQEVPVELENQNITSAVEASMGIFLDGIPDAALKNYGIKERKEVAKSTIGAPLAVYTMANDTLLFTNTWRVPLVIDDEYRALFTVYKNSDEAFQVVDFGAVKLAQEIDTKRKSDELYGMLRIYELRKDFFIKENKEAGFEFQSVRESEKQSYSLKELLDFIKK